MNATSKPANATDRWLRQVQKLFIINTNLSVLFVFIYYFLVSLNKLLWGVEGSGVPWAKIYTVVFVFIFLFLWARFAKRLPFTGRDRLKVALVGAVPLVLFGGIGTIATVGMLMTGARLGIGAFGAAVLSSACFVGAVSCVALVVKVRPCASKS